MSKTHETLRIAVDMDEVITDTLGKQLRLYNQRCGTSASRSDLHGNNLVDIAPTSHKEWLVSMLYEPGFFADLEPMPGSLGGMERLCAQHDVFIASAATQFPNSFNEKIAWLKLYLPQIPLDHIIFCGDKSILNVDYLIDDSAYHFKGLRGVGLLFDAPHNRKNHEHFRVYGWAEVENAIALHEARKSGDRLGLYEELELSAQ
ncbi:5'-3'-deoxyribonucleotidase [Granulicella sp. S156]|uniref:5' nucleotidase, NT5C type n=1 Tax=Granulicella sp. S156 TaxID=1747224 RepID=UPI00131AB1E6|nr:5'-3'-deoxyribonucleotidase [Granulicella sp. S156]